MKMLALKTNFEKEISKIKKTIVKLDGMGPYIDCGKFNIRPRIETRFRPHCKVFIKMDDLFVSVDKLHGECWCRKPIPLNGKLL